LVAAVEPVEPGAPIVEPGLGLELEAAESVLLPGAAPVVPLDVVPAEPIVVLPDVDSLPLVPLPVLPVLPVPPAVPPAGPPLVVPELPSVVLPVEPVPPALPVDPDAPDAPLPVAPAVPDGLMHGVVLLLVPEEPVLAPAPVAVPLDVCPKARPAAAANAEAAMAAVMCLLLAIMCLLLELRLDAFPSNRRSRQCTS
jgi:hypothetical protein